ncbi:MAG: GntR family transcriptional regulator [Hymenobacter sp.]|nr:GntR family transcriptional regulator [Hymenobacter sp.]
MYALQFKPQDKVPKYKQIVNSVITDIERGVLRNGAQLPSISEMSEEHYLARATVERSYRELRERGFITSVQGKGYYVEASNTPKLKILLVFNKLSSYKKTTYYAFLKALGDRASVDLQIHHYNACTFQEIIAKNLGKYNYYVVMPHFTQDTDKADYKQVLNSIPAQELVLIDKDVSGLKNKCLAVFQKFDWDVFSALESANDLLAKYFRLVLIVPSDGNFPVEIAWGVRSYCQANRKECAVVDRVPEEGVVPGTAYVMIETSVLGELVRLVRQTPLVLGQDVGLISFNETTLKEVMGITVITTDFECMGRTTAQLLLERVNTKVHNPFKIIRRGSL